MIFPISPWDFFLVFGRTASLFAFFPMFSEARIPKKVLVAVPFWISLAAYPLLKPTGYQPSNLIDLGMALGLEMVVGVFFAIALRAIFSGILLGTHWIDTEIGFGAGQQLNPLTGIQNTPFSNIAYIIAAMIFWVTGMFESLLLFWIKMFQVLPPPIHQVPQSLGTALIHMSSEIFVGALQIVAPVLLVMFLVSLLVGFIARAVQGVNLFVENYNMKLLGGLALLMVISPILYRLMELHLNLSMDRWIALLNAWKN